MSLKNNWKPKTDDDYVEAEDINTVADAVIELEEKMPSGGVTPDGTPIIIDDKMSPTSENPVQNKVIFAYVEEQNNITKGLAVSAGQMSQQANTTAEKAKQKAENAESIAKGRATGYVFDTFSHLTEWISIDANKEKLVLGDNLYIRAVDVPDYWWDGENIYPLETQKVDLTEYVKKDDLEELVLEVLPIYNGEAVTV